MELGTPHMTYVKVQADLDVILVDTKLDRVKQTKFLGVIIDECLTWKHHIECVSRTIARNIGVINKLKQCVPEHILHTVLFILYSSNALLKLILINLLNCKNGP